MENEDVVEDEKVDKNASKTLLTATGNESNRGIIYLSKIPSHMSVKKGRHLFQQYGQLDRIFFQPEAAKNKKKKAGQGKTTSSKNRGDFSEGWIEFLDKKIAKRVALSLNNTQIGGKKRSPWYWDIWNIKYLPKFKWSHLNERLAYEKAVHQQRMRTEITQAKREANHFAQNLERSKLQNRLEKKSAKSGEKLAVREWTFEQKDTEEEILGRKQRKRTQQQQTEAPSSGKKSKKSSPSIAAVDKDFLRNIFSGGGKSNGSDLDDNA
ncbi:activator of basal transcription 1-like [Tubulanus polymorphus]|uniref:activator of basal transcription 1-like n=1 Tax=Tubulanus polymorphus TaxID=672921 RepID=UPI003DA4AA6B